MCIIMCVAEPEKNRIRTQWKECLSRLGDIFKWLSLFTPWYKTFTDTIKDANSYSYEAKKQGMFGISNK